VTWFFTSFVRKIAGFKSETRASDDYTQFRLQKGEGVMPRFGAANYGYAHYRSMKYAMFPDLERREEVQHA